MNARILLACISAAVACTGAPAERARAADRGTPTAAHRYVLCSMVTKEEMQAVTGEPYTIARADDDPHSSRSSCQYSVSADGVPVVVELEWLSDADDTDPAARATLERIPINVARKGTGVIDKTAGLPEAAPPPGFEDREISGLGDEAFFGLGTLTVRAGEKTIRVIISPMGNADTFAMLKDSSANRAIVEHEKAVARVVLTKL